MSFFFILTCVLEHVRFSGFVLPGSSLHIHVVEASSRSPFCMGKLDVEGAVARLELTLDMV